MFTEIALFLKAINPIMWARIAGVIALIALIAFVTFHIEQWGEFRRGVQDNKTIVSQQTTITGLTAEITKANAIYAKQKSDNAVQAKAWKDQLQESDDEADKALTAQKAVNDATTTLNGQLRKQLSSATVTMSRLPDTAAARASISEYVDVLTDVFADCSISYQGMADQDTKHFIDEKRLYDGWPTNPVNPPTAVVPVSTPNATVPASNPQGN